MAKDTGLHSQLANELKGMDRRKSRVFDSAGGDSSHCVSSCRRCSLCRVRRRKYSRLVCHELGRYPRPVRQPFRRGGWERTFHFWLGLCPVGGYLRTGCTSAILSVFLQQHEGRPWLDVLLCAEEVSDGQLKMYRPITAFELVLFDGRTITVGFATPEEVSSLKWSVMSMLPNAECVEDGSIDRKACRKLSWDFKKKYSFRIGAFRRDFLD